MVVRGVVSRCLDETVNPLKEKISQSLSFSGIQPKTVPVFLHFLDWYKAVKPKIPRQFEVLLLL